MLSSSESCSRKHHARLALEAMYEHQLDEFRQWLLFQLEWPLLAKRRFSHKISHMAMMTNQGIWSPGNSDSIRKSRNSDDESGPALSETVKEASNKLCKVIEA